MSMLLLATVYVFSIILAVFLTGLAIGGAGASWVIRRIRPQLALGLCQLLLVVAIAWTAMVIVRILPYWSDAILTTTSPWEMFLLDLQRCLLRYPAARALVGRELSAGLRQRPSFLA